MENVKLREGINLEQYIKISANSIGELRKTDVYRVIDSLRSDNLDGVSRSDLATFIVAKRSDLAAEVTQVMLEEWPEDDWAPEPMVVTTNLGRLAPIDADHEFRNFHRLLCERFGYVHDPVDWKRDQLSLIEWIANGRPLATST